MLSFGEGADEDGLKKLSGTVHDEGAKIMAQLVHAGSNRMFDPGFPAEGPSAVPHRMSQVTPVQMSADDISQVIKDYAVAAARAVEYGYDAVQIHAAHEYLLSSFLSPFSNNRTDQYGGSIENRARLLFEVYRAVRDVVGDDFPVTVKINIRDFYDDGLTADDSAWVCRELSAMGINAIEVSATGGPEFMGMFTSIDDQSKEAYLEDLAKNLRPQIDCPLILVGGVRSYDVADRITSENTADFISMSRPLISEPDLINQWNAGTKKDSRCISCAKCLMNVLQGGEVRCYEFEPDG